MIKSLVVDDEIVSRSKMMKIMSSLGDCVAVDSGRAALKAFREAWENWVPFDLITMDVNMPEMDGTQTLYEIRKMETDKGVSEKLKASILMVTARSDRDTIVTCVQAGCDGYITKPFDLNSIKKKLNEIGLKA